MGRGLVRNRFESAVASYEALARVVKEEETAEGDKKQ